MSQSGRLGVTDANLPSDVPTSFITDAGMATPIAHVIELLGGAGASTSAVGNIITITVAAAPQFTWNRISASQPLLSNNGYFCIGGGALVLSLPVISALGDTIEIVLDGSASFTVTQSAGQSIKFGNQVTTTGVGGSISSLSQGDVITMVCETPDLRWVITDSMGNLTFI